MTFPLLADVVRTAHELWPQDLAESWDASGLVCGREDAEVRSILWAVDPTRATAEEAVRRDAQLLLTHHPLLLRGAQFLPAAGDKGAVVHRLIENGVGLLASHTNADSYAGGVSDALLAACGVENGEPLSGHADDPSTGLGRVGDLEAPVWLEDLAQTLAARLLPTAGGLRVAGPRDAPVQRIAVCGGAGDSLFDRVRDAEADVYVTADLRHHPASEARERSLGQGGTPYLIDCSHFASEQLWLADGARQLRDALAAQGFSVQMRLSELNTDPWDFVVRPAGYPGSASTDPQAARYTS